MTACLQIVMTANKEAVINEKKLRVRFGQKVLTGYAEPIHPADYPSFEDFVTEIQTRWDALWKRVYAADISGKPKNVCPKSLLRSPKTQH